MIDYTRTGGYERLKILEDMIFFKFYIWNVSSIHSINVTDGQTKLVGLYYVNMNGDSFKKNKLF